VIRWLGRNLLTLYALLAIGYLLLPVAVITVLSFNKPQGRQNTTWNEFSLDAWTNICRDQTICSAFGTSLRLGLLVTIVGTVLGTLISLALIRHRFAGRTAMTMLVFLPLATPEVILGASLLAFFLNLLLPLGFWALTIAHVMFTISFVVLIVNARLAGMDPRLEQAAMDLYATPLAAFRFVTWPLLAPGVAAAALLSFTLSFDDFIISNFTSGTTVTFPIYIWGAALRGIPPQVNVIATIVFAASVLLVLLAMTLAATRRPRTKEAGARAQPR